MINNGFKGFSEILQQGLHENPNRIALDDGVNRVSYVN